MATQTISRSILRRPAESLSRIFTRSFASSSPLANSPTASRSAFPVLNRSRPLVAGFSTILRAGQCSARDLSTQATSSSLTYSNPNGSNRPPNETILLDGCDFEHWLVVVEAPEPHLSRDEIIDSYIKTLAQVVGSEEEARMKIYSVSHRCYFAFGALVSEDLSHKLKDLPNVRWVLPDSYLDVKNKDYGGEPFIDGKAVPYDPKYHEEWIRNNAKANDRNNRNNRNRNPSDRGRDFERRRENNRGNQDMGYNRGPPPNQGMGGAAPPPNLNQNYRGPPPPPNYQGTPPPNMNQSYRGPPPPPNYQGPPPPSMNQSYQGPPPPNMGQNYNGPPQPPPNMNQNYQGPPPPNMNGGWSGN